MLVTKILGYHVRYDNIRAFEKHLEGAAPQHFSPLYAIIGKESFDCKEALDLLLRFLIPSKQEMSFNSWDGARADIKELMADLYSQSFFADKRVIVIQQADKLKKNVLEELEKYIKRTARNQHLILCASTFSRQTAFYRLIEKEGIILEFAELKPWEKEKRLIEWVGKQAAAARKIMSYQVCQQFVKQLGTDQNMLSNELEKLFCYVNTKQEITWHDVEQICTQTPLESVWQLGESIFRRDAQAALRICQGLLLDGQPFLPLLRQIRNQFATEYHVCTLLEQGQPASAITEEFPYMKGQILERHIASARQYGMQAFKWGLLAIDAAEIQAKNSQIDEQFLAEILIVKLTTMKLS